MLSVTCVSPRRPGGGDGLRSAGRGGHKARWGCTRVGSPSVKHSSGCSPSGSSSTWSSGSSSGGL